MKTNRPSLPLVDDRLRPGREKERGVWRMRHAKAHFFHLDQTNLKVKKAHSEHNIGTANWRTASVPFHHSPSLRHSLSATCPPPSLSLLDTFRLYTLSLSLSFKTSVEAFSLSLSLSIVFSVFSLRVSALLLMSFAGVLVWKSEVIFFFCSLIRVFDDGYGLFSTVLVLIFCGFLSFSLLHEMTVIENCMRLFITCLLFICNSLAWFLFEKMVWIVRY